jgi:hypothetical protein
MTMAKMTRIMWGSYTLNSDDAAATAARHSLSTLIISHKAREWHKKSTRFASATIGTTEQ